MDRFNANRIIAAGYALTAVAIWAIGQAAGRRLAGGGGVHGRHLMNTAQSSMPALAAAYYPTRGRATGVAWMLGIGRFGGIAGSFLVAELSPATWASAIFAVVAIPGIIATRPAAGVHRPSGDGGAARAWRRGCA
jgi:AAHS family 4-hydroxybenzoate transporter-like MFS transporter